MLVTIFFVINLVFGIVRLLMTIFTNDLSKDTNHVVWAILHLFLAFTLSEVM